MGKVAIAGGRRERNKAEKLTQIRQAARELFLENGYDDTTIREIAQRADVGFGTLFTYASDKRDLLFLIFNDELDAIADTFERLPQDGTLIDRLITYFQRYYRFWGAQPALSRFMLRELTFYIEGKQARQFQDSRDLLIRQLVIMVGAAQAQGVIRAREQAGVMGNALFITYAAELRAWLGGESQDLAQGLARLRQMLVLQIGGFEPGTGAL